MAKTDKQYLVYLAGSISGRTYDEAVMWRNRLSAALEDDPNINVKCISPMRGKAYLSKETAIKEYYPNTIMSGAKAIYLRDRFDVMRSDIILINMQKEEDLKSVGTASEQAWGKSTGKMVIIITNGILVEHPFLTEEAIMVDYEDDAIRFIRWLLS